MGTKDQPEGFCWHHALFWTAGCYLSRKEVRGKLITKHTRTYSSIGHKFTELLNTYLYRATGGYGEMNPVTSTLASLEGPSFIGVLYFVQMS